MNLFLPSGYVNMKKIFKLPEAFIFVTGARGTGKTYGGMECLLDHEILPEGRKFIYMRRTSKQLEIALTPEMNPFKPLNEKRKGTPEIHPFSINKYISGFYKTVINEDGDLEPLDGVPIGIAIPLSTFASVRGISAEDVDVMFYDEFIPQRDERKMKNEYEALLNAYETINRNRELQGRPPVKLIAVSNSNDIANPVYMGARVIKDVIDMRRKKVNCKEFPKRNMALIDIQDSPISLQKANTALYQFAKDTQFTEMAIYNDYGYIESNTKSLPHRELVPLYRVGEIQIDRWKGHDNYYVTSQFHGSVKESYSTSDIDIRRFSIAHRDVVTYYYLNAIVFEDFYLESVFIKMFLT